MGENLHLTSNRWSLWFHKINDKSWTLDSYKKIADIDSIEKYKYYYSKIESFVSGMFFLMKNDIIPLWEDKNNINGGIVTYKVPKKLVLNIWEELTMAIIGNSLTEKIEDHKFVNGISISPKINNCIIKIWINKSSMLTKIKFTDILLFKNNTPIYKTFNNTTY